MAAWQAKMAAKNMAKSKMAAWRNNLAKGGIINGEIMA
jgi:hypothetical protein